MSNKAITWAYARTDLKGGPKFVLVTLADMADQEHSCYPGVPELARLTGYGETAVREALATLTSGGYISRERRFRKDGSRTSNRYYLDVNGALAEERLKPDSGSGTKAGFRGGQKPDSEVTKAGFRGGILEPPVNPQNEPKDLTLIEPDAIAPEPTVEERFEQLWKLWPRKDAKKAALGKFTTAVKRTPPAEIHAAAAAWLAHPSHADAQFVPYLATWLNQERWTDELPPAAGAPPGRPLTNLERALLDYETRYGDNHGPASDPPALDPGRGDR